MCLYIKLFSKKKTAKEDIICYKYVLSPPCYGNYKPPSDFKTPFRDAVVKEGETYKSKLSRIWNVVGEGLHTFKKPIPTGLMWEIFMYTCEDFYLATCIIPKGAKYYKGKSDKDIFFTEGYASSELKYVKIEKL